jgi:hypothetical protein
MQQQTKSIREWFEFANAQNYPWADAALSNALNPVCTMNLGITHQTNTLSGALVTGFEWERSPQGKYYWKCIYDSLIDAGI